MVRFIQALRYGILALFLASAGPLMGQDATSLNAVIGADGIPRVPVTNLPLPRFVSLKASEANIRRGPSLSHRIDWIFTRRDMPLQVVAEYGHWRRIVDRDGIGGWVHYTLLSGTRSVIIDKDLQPIFVAPDKTTGQVALLESGVVARLGPCEVDWCRVTAGGYRGWAPKEALWGVNPDELRE